jgi:nitrite reductase/ring-hydroxylating ferredoxin subunit
MMETRAGAAARRPELPRQAWYIAAPSCRLADRPLPVTIFEQRLVLFRDADGAARALLDRCPHRGVPLSLGRVKGGEIECPYHGWRFRGNGRCAHIPSLLDGGAPTRSIGVPHFHCVEGDGYVWVWMGDGPPAPERPLPIAEYSKRRWRQGTVELACSSMASIENNLDWCHPYFTHPNTHEQHRDISEAGFRETAYEVRANGTGLTLFAPVTADESEPPPLVGARMVFELPDRVTVSAGGSAGGSLIVLHMVPTGPHSCRQEWLFAAGPGSGEVEWSDAAPVVLEQDRLVLEAAEPAYRETLGSFERSVEADAAPLMARRIVRLAAAGRWPGELRDTDARRVVSVRS